MSGIRYLIIVDCGGLQAAATALVNWERTKCRNAELLDLSVSEADRPAAIAHAKKAIDLKNAIEDYLRQDQKFFEKNAADHENDK